MMFQPTGSGEIEKDRIVPEKELYTLELYALSLILQQYHRFDQSISHELYVLLANFEKNGRLTQFGLSFADDLRSAKFAEYNSKI